MKAFFFGNAGRQLFGAYHEAAEESPRRDAAVLICYPWMSDYNMTHWAMRNLAVALAREGFATLRFDYGGTGDSMGSAASADVAEWADDVVTAGRELLERSGLQQLSLVGKGLGAALAVRASAALPVRDLVLWDPVVSGRDYLDELDRVDAGQRVARLYPPTAGPRDELLGFAVPRTQRDAISRINLVTTKPRLTGAVTVVATDEHAAYDAFRQALVAGGGRVGVEHVAEPVDENVTAGLSALMSASSLAAIAAAVVRGDQP